MKWALTHTANQLHYWKMQENEFTAELKYNEQAQSFRLTADDKRLFFIEKTGFLQNKFLLKTEYSVVTGEVYPVKNWHSGIATIEDKKFKYFLKNNLLVLLSRKANFEFAIEVDHADILNQSELCALLFSSLRVLTKSFTKTKPALA